MKKPTRPLALLSVCVGLSACTVAAPPVEDLQGNGFNVEGGVLNVDESKIPVVDACEDGQAVVKSGEGWACVSLADGLSGDATTIRVDFGDGATQVASGDRMAAAEGAIIALDDDITALDGRVTGLETGAVDLDARVDAVEGKVLQDFFIETCDQSGVGGLRLVGGALSVCDGVAFRAITVAAPTPPALIADYQQQDADVGGVARIWTNRVSGGEPLFLGSDVVRFVPAPSPPGAVGLARGAGAGAGFSAPIGHGRLTLPERNFSVEIIYTGSDTIFSHGQGGLQISALASPTIREGGRESRYQPPVTAPDASRPNHLVYVHDANNGRHLYLNGQERNLEADSSAWTGPYLGGTDIAALGSPFGGAPAGGNPLMHHRVTIHGVALSAAEVQSRCVASQAAPFLVQACN